MLPAMLVNGEQQQQVSVLERAFQCGDGLFETLRVADGEPQHWQRHLRRLRKGCERLLMPLPDEELLWAEGSGLCREVESGVLKIILSRGRGQRGYAVPAGLEPTRVISLSVPPHYPPAWQTQGVRLTVCETPLGINPRLAGIKHLNRLEQVLARAEWQDGDISEGLMLDMEGRLIEGTMSNVFCVQGAELFTPDLCRCGVEGITRERVIEAASGAGHKVVITDMSVDDLKQADEVFVCNSLIGVWPVRQLDEKKWLPGPLTLGLIQKLTAGTARGKRGC